MTAYDRVLKILKENKESRSNDNLLEWIYYSQLGFTENGSFPRSSYLTKPPSETITRARREVQEHHPELQASEEVKAYREEKRQDFPRWLFDEKTNTAKQIC